ncbi:MAG: MOP flippase family protein [Anaerolineae bacterium]|nr:MOP flippase family protein [Anaerolineae bacterium]MCB0210507.1 MOP flippase family protein [Anaerolineae bacterium]
MSLREQAAAGAKWTSSTMIIVTGLQFFQLAVLARLLSPEDFGLMAMIGVVLGFANAFADMGVSNAIIYHQNTTRAQLSSLYWLNLMVGFVIFLLVWAATPLIVAFYNEPQLSELIFWAALGLLIVPFGQQFQVLLHKELQFDVLAKVQILSTLAGVTVAIGSAWAGQGVFALVWGSLTSSSVNALLLTWWGWRSWRPMLHFNFFDIQSYISFGLYQMGERSVNYFAANVDYMIVGRFLGPELLGLYRLAYELVLKPLRTINPILTKIAFPVFAKKQTNDVALRRGYLEVIKLLAMILFPITVGFIVTAPLIVPVVFGPSWVGAIPLVQILAVVGLLKALSNPTGAILLAKGRADIGFKWNVYVVVLNTGLFLSVVSYGVYAIAWSYVAVSLLNATLLWIILCRTIYFGYYDLVPLFLLPLAWSLIMGLVVYAGYVLLSEWLVTKVMLLLILVAMGGGVYSLLAMLFEYRYFYDLWILIFSKKQEAV